MKTCDKCGKEHADDQRHVQDDSGKCTATVTFNRGDVVRAEGAVAEAADKDAAGWWKNDEAVQFGVKKS